MYLRNFVSSGAFDKLLEDKDFKISTAKQVDLSNLNVPKSKLLDSYIRSDVNKKTIYTFNQIAIRRLRKKSKTFDIKVRAYKKDPYNWAVQTLFSQPFIYNYTKKIILNKLKPNKTLEKIIKDYKPQLIILPMTGTEATSYELILMQKKYNFKTFFLMNGWDNLSSKCVFLLKPDYLGVWGPQQLSDAVTVQDIEPERCFLLGCARYEDFFQKNKSPKSPFPFKYILFAGTQTAHDEITPLKLFDKIIEKSGIKDIKLIYRPHPNREIRVGNDFFDEKEYKHTIIDPQVAYDYYNNKKTGLESTLSQNFPKLDYNTGLLKYAQFIISPMSSLILESALFDVPSLIPANSDDPNPISPSSHTKWQHFRGAEDVPGWFIGNNYNEIEKLFTWMLKNFKNDTPKNRHFSGILRPSMKKYLYFDENSYAERLNESVKIILSSDRY